MAESGTASGSWRMGRPGTAERMAAGPELGKEGSVTVRVNLNQDQAAKDTGWYNQVFKTIRYTHCKKLKNKQANKQKTLKIKLVY